MVSTMEWCDKGCGVCRKLWERGVQPPEIGINPELHTRLHRCTACGIFWEQNERHADVVCEATHGKAIQTLIIPLGAPARTCLGAGRCAFSLWLKMRQGGRLMRLGQSPGRKQEVQT
jgi:hypothetical protein